MFLDVSGTYNLKFELSENLKHVEILNSTVFSISLRLVAVIAECGTHLWWTTAAWQMDPAFSFGAATETNQTHKNRPKNSSLAGKIGIMYGTVMVRSTFIHRINKLWYAMVCPCQANRLHRGQQHYLQLTYKHKRFEEVSLRASTSNSMEQRFR